MHKKKTMARTWLGFAVVTLVAGSLMSAGGLRAQTSEPSPVAPAPVAPAKPQGEAVPAAPKVPAALPQDVVFGRFIALIRAHLFTGDELVSQRDWDVAARHFSFPAEEIYGMIRGDLRIYKTPPFDDALKALAATAKSHNAKQYPKALKKVQDALAAADAGLKSRQANWPRFVVEVAIETLKAVPDEYGDAIAKGRIVRPIGYQTARGFILQADRMIESAAGELEAGNAAALGDVRAGFAQLKQAFATVTAPKQVVMDEAAVLGLVSRIELAAGRL
jgi:hypothetical protein